MPIPSQFCKPESLLIGSMEPCSVPMPLMKTYGKEPQVKIVDHITEASDLPGSVFRRTEQDSAYR